MTNFTFTDKLALEAAVRGARSEKAIEAALKKAGFDFENVSDEYGYPNFRMETADGYIRIYRNSRKETLIQEWKKDLGITVGKPDRDQAQPEPAAQLSVVDQRLERSAPGAARHGDIDRVADGLALDRLVEQGQRKTGFKFDNDRIVTLTDGDDVGGTDLPLHRVALRFEQVLHGTIEIGFPDAGLSHETEP